MAKAKTTGQAPTIRGTDALGAPMDPEPGRTPHLLAQGRATIGYPNPRRRRVRDAQRQVNNVVTARVRELGTASWSIQHELPRDLRELHSVLNDQTATDKDLRACYVALAATAILLAENADVPADIERASEPVGQLVELRVQQCLALRDAA